MSRRLVTLEEAVQAVVKRHGGVRAAERATGVDKGFISRLMRGEKVNPSADTLEALGLRAVPLYEVHAYAAAAVEAEREQCARICDTTPPYPFRASIEAAHAIRARSKAPAT